MYRGLQFGVSLGTNLVQNVRNHVLPKRLSFYMQMHTWAWYHNMQHTIHGTIGTLHKRRFYSTSFFPTMLLSKMFGRKLHNLHNFIYARLRAG